MPELLIVDDDPSIRALIARALQDLGRVEVATGGAEALHRLGRKAYDCIFMDLHMPMIDGFRVLEILGKSGPNKDTPLFVVTADVSQEARVRALRDNVVFVLTKPISVMTLRTLVAATLGRRKPREPSSEKS